MASILARSVGALLLVGSISIGSAGFGTFIGSVQAQSTSDSATSPGTNSTKPATSLSERAETLSRLEDLRAQIVEREKTLAALRRETRGIDVATLDWDKKKQLKELPEQLGKLEESFRQIAVNGLDLSVLSNDETKEYNWEAELVEIVRPVIGTMKSLTEKPRKIESLRQGISRAEKQEVTLSKALQALVVLQQGKTGPVASPLSELHRRWTTQLDETVATRQLYVHQLATLEKGDDISAWETASNQLNEFIYGRGVTLAILFSAILTIWILTRAALSIAMRIAGRGSKPRSRRSRERAMRYLYRGITALLMVGAAVTVFYLRSDMLFLALSIIGMVMTAAALRQAVPRYIAEIRILLGFGSVREGERLMLNGVPMKVYSINAFAKLHNPLLEGSIRIPLESLPDHASRPDNEEPWFPCETGDIVLFDGERYGHVVAQSVEKVQLRALGSPVHVATSEFLGMSPVNLSRDGYLVSQVFGIDYRHQAICLDEVPDKMQQAVEQAVHAADYAQFCEKVTVEFKQAAASSLDYLIMVRMSGGAASSYFAVGRRIQQALVGLSNREQWSIPFGQLTVHAGDGFTSPVPTTIADQDKSTVAAT